MRSLVPRRNMIMQILYIYGFSLLLLSKVYAVYWNDTDYLNGVGRDHRRIRNKFVTFDTTDTDIEVWLFIYF